MKPRWNALRQQLTDEARRALSSANFDERNERHARSVAQEGCELAIAAGIDARALFAVFDAATKEAGAAFVAAFASDGKPRADNEREYKQAVSGAGPIAYRHLVDARPTAPGVLVRTRLGDLARMLMPLLGVAQSVTEPAVLAALGQVVPRDDSFFEEIAKIPRTQASDQPPLTAEERSTLALGLRLAHATWKAGQVHRAAWEADDSRIDSEKRINFLPYDAFLRRRYEDVIAANRSAAPCGDARAERGHVRGIQGLARTRESAPSRGVMACFLHRHLARDLHAPEDRRVTSLASD